MEKDCCKKIHEIGMGGGVLRGGFYFFLGSGFLYLLCGGEILLLCRHYLYTLGCAPFFGATS